MNRYQIFAPIRLNKIKSEKILIDIISYIKEENWKLKLFAYSKHFKNLLKIQLEDYQERFLMKKNIYLCNYLNLEKNPKYFQIIEEFNKKGIDNPYLVDDILKSQLKSDLLNKNINIKINNNLVQKYFNKYFENKKIKDEYEYDHSDNDYPKEVIDINSPVFEQISENGMLEKFSVLITLNRKINSKLKNNYSSVFDKLNESKTKYSSMIVNIKNNTNLNYLTQYKIDFKQIKCLTINANEEYIYIYKQL